MELSELLNSEFKKFCDQWHGVMTGSEMQTLAKFIEQVKNNKEGISGPESKFRCDSRDWYKSKGITAINGHKL